MSKKILYIINHMDWFWSHRLPLARGAQQDGWSVYVAAPDAGWDRKLADQGFIGLELPSSKNPFGIFKTIAAIAALLKQVKPDLMHAITLKYAFMSGLAARSYPEVKAVHTIAGLGYLFSGEGWRPHILRLIAGPLLRLSLKRKNTQIIFQNPDDENLMIRRGFVEAGQCHLIRGSGVDTAEFPFAEEPPYKTPLVIMPTRLVHEKGISVFVEAARILQNRGIDARFQIAGGLSENNPRAISETEINRMVADEAVQWLGKVKNMPDLLANCTLVVYPSWYGEGVPKVLLEAASSGRAIVTTDHPGCREAVRDGENGLLVPVKNAAATADAIEKLLQDPQRRKAMGLRGRARAEQEFDARIIVEKTLKIYRV